METQQIPEPQQQQILPQQQQHVLRQQPQQQPQQQLQQLQLGVQVDNSALMAVLAENNINGHYQMLMTSEPVVLKSLLSIQIDSMLGVQGVDSFEEYRSLVKEKAKQGACEIVRQSLNETTVTTSNIAFSMQTVLGLLDSRSFSLAVISFFKALNKALTSDSGESIQRLWRSQKVIRNGDYFISVVSLQAERETKSRTLTSFVGYSGVQISFNLKINVIEYFVPSELLPK